MDSDVTGIGFCAYLIKLSCMPVFIQRVSSDLAQLPNGNIEAIPCFVKSETTWRATGRDRVFF